MQVHVMRLPVNELRKSTDRFSFVTYSYLCILLTRVALFFFQSSPPFVRPPRGICNENYNSIYTYSQTTFYLLYYLF